MDAKKRVYESNVMGLPPLKMVLGDVPDPDVNGYRRPFRSFGEEKPVEDVEHTVNRLISHLKDKK